MEANFGETGGRALPISTHTAVPFPSSLNKVPMFTTPHLLGAQNSSCIGKQLSFRHCSTLSEHTKDSCIWRHASFSHERGGTAGKKTEGKYTLRLTETNVLAYMCIIQSTYRVTVNQMAEGEHLGSSHTCAYDMMHCPHRERNLSSVVQSLLICRTTNP